MVTTANIADRITDVLRHGLANLRRRSSHVNEAVTRSVLIDRVLEELGYPPTHRSPEDGISGNRPDDQCYVDPVGPAPGHPALVVEAKRLGADFDRALVGQHRGSSPDRQIKRYLSTATISGPDTIGVLTDGVRWRLYRRALNTEANDVEHLENFDFSDLARHPLPTLDALEGPGRLEEFVRQLSRGAIYSRTVPGKRPALNLADNLFEIVTATASPEQILKALLSEPDAITSNRLENADSLTGIRKDALLQDWETYSVAQGPMLITDPPALEPRIAVAAVKFRHDPARGFSRGDVALFARTVASTSITNSAALFAYETAPDGSISARMAVSAAGQVNMTAHFDPAVPTPSARSAIDQQLRLIRDTKAPITADKLLSPFAVATLRQQFYREITQWTTRIQHGKNKKVREAVLRHLIRVMFAWILKEDNRIPPEIFEPAFNHDHLQSLDHYHSEVLRFLFHQRLNVRQDLRDEHPVPKINEALDQAPFLNGSLFANQDGDDSLNLNGTDYWSVDSGSPGLSTILSRYHWTLDEHRPGESEQTLDPELLSNLFERLIASTEQGPSSKPRHPQGTYYTPADIADEMVKDALSAALKDQAGTLDETQLLGLFGISDAPLLDTLTKDKDRLANCIRSLRIFDPAVGSGEFLLSSLLSIRRSLKKLGVEEPAETIIRRQLRGQDINPLAVQIARLRLFIAITASRKATSANDMPPDSEPLPNLEAVIVCADTLETIADPESLRSLDMVDPQVDAAVKRIAEIRAQWFDVHSESDKLHVQNQDTESRAHLEQLLRQNGALTSREMRTLARSKLLSNNPAKTDARLLFYESPWRGFDIVIGNPPYEALGKSRDDAERKRLQTQKRYRTVGGGDLYNLFCETALALTKPAGGVVSLIVPLSVAFAQKQAPLRRAFESRCSQITLRHYDNIPDTIFNGSPTLKTWNNSQRATTLTAVLGNGGAVVNSTGLQRWAAGDRKPCLDYRASAIAPKLGPKADKRIADQWVRAPTKEVASLVNAILEQSRTVLSFGETAENGKTLTFPMTARYFISAIPRQIALRRSERSFAVGTELDLRLLMAVLNGHVGYAWWRIVGDGFHVNFHELTTMTVPDAWIQAPQRPMELGQRLLGAIPQCLTEKKNKGSVWQNVNFHLKPDLIAEVDRLHIAALGLPEEPLLTHLRIMRSTSSWNYPSA